MNFISSIFEFFSRVFFAVFAFFSKAFFALLFILFTVLIIGALTNPSREDHINELRPHIAERSGSLNSILFSVSNTDIHYRSYLVASSMERKGEIISVGLLNNIIIEDFDELFN